MVVEIGPDRLTHGYERKPYFWLNTAVEGVVFEAPVSGATTPNSTNPRSELRQLFGNGEPAAWSNSNSTWNMEAEIAFTVLPGDDRGTGDLSRGVVGMQVHDGKDDVTVLRLERDLKLWATKGNDPNFDLLDGSYVLGTWMTVRIKAQKGGGFLWFLNGTHVATIPGVKSECYFKIGAYVQIGDHSTGKGQTHVRKLRVWKE